MTQDVFVWLCAWVRRPRDISNIAEEGFDGETDSLLVIYSGRVCVANLGERELFPDIERHRDSKLI